MNLAIPRIGFWLSPAVSGLGFSFLIIEPYMETVTLPRHVDPFPPSEEDKSSKVTFWVSQKQFLAISI